MWVAILLVCLGNAQTYVEHGPNSGVCVDATTGASAPNFSKNAVGVLSCRAQCNLDGLCVGFSHAADLGGNAVNRCAIWIDRNSLNHGQAMYNGWEVHNYPGWQENVLDLDGGDGANGWACYVRDDSCSAGSLVAGGVTMTYPEIDQGMYVDLECEDFSSVHFGTVRVECKNGVAGKIGNGTCAQLEIPDWTPMDGPGVCRDTTNQGTITPSVGPGVSPPNFSKEGLTLDQCKQACIDETLICTAISWGGESGSRCALFISVDTAFCGNKNGWETHPYQYGWDQNNSAVDGASGEAGWKCYVRALPDLQYQLMAGTGVCANSSDDSPSNYSRSGVGQPQCLAECTGYAQCLGFAHNLAANRCAIYMNIHTSLPGLADWEEHLGEPGWASDPMISKADQVGSGWLCYKKLTRRKL